MGDKTYSLERGGQQVATITDATYVTPTSTGKAIFSDEELHKQLIQAYDFELWVEHQPDDLTDEAYETEKNKREVTDETLSMVRGVWTLTAGDGTKMKTLAPVF